VEALNALPGSFAAAPVVVYLKLKSPRQKDRADVVELFKSGVDLEECRRYLQKHAPRYIPAFEQALAAARAEE
jgi:hypothetical protein